MHDNFENNIKSKLQNHEMAPPPMAWDNISKNLQKNEPKISHWVLWTRIAAAIMIPALMAVSLWYFNSQDLEDNSNHGIANNPSNTTNTGEPLHESNTSIPDTFDNLLNMQTPTAMQVEQQAQSNDKSYATHNVANKVKTVFSQTNNLNSFANYIASFWSESKTYENNAYYPSTTPQRKVNFLTAMVSPLRNRDRLLTDERMGEDVFINEQSKLQVTLLDTSEDIKAELIEEPFKMNIANRFEISPYAGIVFLGSSKEQSLIAPEFNALQVDNKLTSRYGAKASYQLNDRLKLRTGVGFLNLQQDMYDVPLAMNTNRGSIKYNVVNHTNASIDLSIPHENQSSFTGYSETSISRIKEDFSYKLQFVEIPLEVEYNISKGEKLNLATTGGMSALVLNQNDLILKEQDALFAEATNMKSVSFTANAGLRLDYALSERVSVNIEPQVKYMINTVTANKEVQPYLLALNAGVSLAL